MKVFTERSSKILFLIGIVVLIISIPLFLYKEDFTLLIDSEKIAHFGDFIGGLIGSLWSAAAFILFYVALKDQREDIQINRDTLRQQIKEFQLQTKELEDTRLVLKDQNITFKVQQFENTFFQLLRLHHEIIDKLTFDINVGGFTTGIAEKRSVFKSIANKTEGLIRSKNSVKSPDGFGGIINTPDTPPLTEIANERLDKIFEEDLDELYQEALSHYFRNLYHIFKFIHLSDLIENNRKKFYSSIVRAQLSSDELFLIFYNSICGRGYPRFLFFIKEYNLLENFDFKRIYEFPFHSKIYESKLNDLKSDLELN
ncbi:putative phage abortive infection protein [Zunongwangia sp. HGR-M22]|uniref:putative phage abortive infection protein n=1 Tax=Zunongwangia sp. HGR-M22 TaxID=3015168 RepID=UPI0022DD6B27|nr:putative phage abortive infection protein [Zunongwangia sp. HGR-M22]WBL27208.1 putative phage abortive infection protein [Zunongwangia sp. HGR-M22]